MKCRRNGFTLTELLVVLTILVILNFLLMLASGLIPGNFYFTEVGVLREIQVDHPDVIKVVDSDRNVFAYSTILVEDQAGQRSEYQIDSWLLCLLTGYDVYPTQSAASAHP